MSMPDQRIRIDAGDFRDQIRRLANSDANPGAGPYLTLIAQHLHEAELKSTDPNELPIANETLEAVVLLLYSLADQIDSN